MNFDLDAHSKKLSWFSQNQDKEDDGHDHCDVPTTREQAKDEKDENAHLPVLRGEEGVAKDAKANGRCTKGHAMPSTGKAKAKASGGCGRSQQSRRKERSKKSKGKNHGSKQRTPSGTPSAIESPEPQASGESAPAQCKRTKNSKLGPATTNKPTDISSDSRAAPGNSTVPLASPKTSVTNNLGAAAEQVEEPQRTYRFNDCYAYSTREEESAIGDLSRELDLSSESEEENQPEEHDWFYKSTTSTSSTGVTVAISEEQIEKFNKEKGTDKEPFYKDLITDQATLLNLLRNRDKYKRCQLKIESSHRSVAKVLDAGSSISEIVLEGRSRCGQTYMDDEVVVEILDAPKERTDSKTKRKSGKADRTVYGQVVGLLWRVNHAETGTHVLYCTLSKEKAYLMKPLCKTVPTIHILNDTVRKKFPFSKDQVEIKEISSSGFLKRKEIFKVNPGKRDMYIFKVVLLTWGKGHVYPLGAVLEVYNSGGGCRGGIERLCCQYRIPRAYPQEVLTETTDLLENTRLHPEREGRKDLTHERVFTIDPPGSKDLDDALSVRRENSHCVVGVHIADVAAVVKEDSAIDQEARKRAVTFYPHLYRPRCMLPEPLSHGECSLLPDQNRLALSVCFTMDENGEETAEPYVVPTIIKSKRQLTYDEAQQVIVGEPSDDIEEDIKLLHNLASKLREKRRYKSVLFVPFDDPRIVNFDSISKSPQAHALVEEFMVRTNIYIAERLRHKFPEFMILRCHQAPTRHQLDEWLQKEGGVANLVMQLQGKMMTSGSPLSAEAASRHQSPDSEKVVVQRGIWEELSRCLEHGDFETARRLAFADDLHPLQCLVNKHWMDLMETAEYRCPHNLNPSEHRHFGLDVDCYTHFTSPIRRYADLHVHRLLHADLNGHVPSCTLDGVINLCREINSAKTRQNAFGKGCLSLKIADSLQRQPLVFRTFVDQVDSEQLTLMVPSLRAVSDSKQVVPFSILGVSSEPEIISNSNVRVEIEKKIYNEEGTCPQEFLADRKRVEQIEGRGSPLEINPHQLSVFLKLEDWQNIIMTLMMKNDESQEQPQQWTHVPQPVQRQCLDVSHITSERGGGSVSLSPCRYRLSFTPSQVIEVQMSADYRRGMLKPQVDLLQLTRNASVCTNHARDPLSAFSSTAVGSKRDQEYLTCADYVYAWIPLLEMEAVYQTRLTKTVTIEDVQITFKKNVDTGDITGNFTLGAKFCFDRCIDFSDMSREDREDEDKTRNTSEVPLHYLCIRYTTACSGHVVSRVTGSALPHAVDRKYTWIGHASVLGVKNKGGSSTSGTIHVSLRLNGNSPPPPKKLLRKGGDKVVVEILPKSDQILLEQLDSKHCEVARAIAVSGCEAPGLEKERVIFGSKEANCEVHVPNVDRELPRNNYMQQKAIQMALTHSVSLIQGPPGTGKTYTGIKLVYLFCKINRQLEAEGKGKKTVLFCGPSNKTIDYVAWLLQITLGKAECPKMVRMYGTAIESQDYPAPMGKLNSTRGRRNLKSDRKLKAVSLHHIIRGSKKPHAEEIARYEKMFDNHRKDPDNTGVESSQIKAYEKLLFSASVEELKNYEVVLTTCSVGGSPRFVEGMKGSVFQVIIDECAMSPEPHSLVPIIATKARQVVLIGDHKQLQPIVTCPAAGELGLDQSLFERLHGRDKFPRVFLSSQYRMHPEICQFPSDEFYDSHLLTERSSLWNVEPLPFWPDHPRVTFSGVKDKVPHLLVDVRGQEETLSVSTDESNEKSKHNAAEVEKVIKIVEFLRDTRHHVELKQIKVLTQYNAQRHKIEAELKQLYGDEIIRQHTVSTVISSQGGEWDYVILSTVRSLPSYKIEPHPTHGWCRQNLGFITNRNQVNVALTRARRGLIIVGNKELLSCDEVWGRLVERYENLHCVREDKEFPPRPVARGPIGHRHVRY
ncbi:hypothetical protein BaRGS_00018228 [Batillaria attramentaria]|uniref:RNB domain-containing protein n=1 Tax=Batillaria attramentaria TaxID=370345 RepID=A0ABD0KTB7_9CAEN